MQGSQYAFRLVQSCTPEPLKLVLTNGKEETDCYVCDMSTNPVLMGFIPAIEPAASWPALSSQQLRQVV